MRRAPAANCSEMAQPRKTYRFNLFSPPREPKKERRHEREAATIGLAAAHRCVPSPAPSYCINLRCRRISPWSILVRRISQVVPASPVLLLGRGSVPISG